MPVKIDDLLKTAASHGASDLHVKAGALPFIRIGGELRPIVDAGRMSPEDTLDMAFSMMSNRQKQRFKEVCEVDIGYGVSGLGRFRANIFQQRGTVGIVLRVIPDRVRSFPELSLPPVIERIADEQRGLVVDTRSFSEALRGALRQDPDVILVGEMRDYETIETALSAAETGHLVLSTLHTLDATETVMRIVSSFPPHQQKSVRIQLAGILKAVISMRLVRAARGAGRVPAVEVMVSTGFIRDCIVNEEKTSQIRDAIAAGTSQYGMQTFDQSLFHLFQSGLISMEEALRGASNPDEFRMRVAGIHSASDQAKEDMERVTTVSSPPPR